jgi:hypothetical protein
MILIRGRDISRGVSLLISGVIVFLVGVLTFVLIFSIYYLRMLTRLNVSNSFGLYTRFLLGDFKWIEFIGPRGLYNFLVLGNFFSLSVD